MRPVSRHDQPVSLKVIALGTTRMRLNELGLPCPNTRSAPLVAPATSVANSY
ncbi:hypothetical protein PLANPX_3917 [Lacipirellula parvula]|uniref:Uncharacterized protein n=1 Tax=Lacipirellula parvula TaxID=2650471 RepID=A0A5K7XD39_9BACT|nr:hypothetical protein PLANPX_3917 [Lacipirellula parvula]